MVPVDNLPLELGVVDFAVRYILVLFDPVVSLRGLVELFEPAGSVSVVVVVLVGCVVFIAVSIVVVGILDVDVGVHVSSGTVKWNQLKSIVVYNCDEMSYGFIISLTVSEHCNGMVSTVRNKTNANRAYSILAPV